MEKENDILKIAGKQNPFKVPDGYFESLTSTVMERLEEPVEQETPVVSMWMRVRPYVYLAAMFIGITCMIRVYTGLTSGVDSDNSIVEQATDEYLLSSVDTYTLYEYLESAE